MAVPDDSFKSGSFFDLLTTESGNSTRAPTMSEERRSNLVEEEVNDLDLLRGLLWTAVIHFALAMDVLCLHKWLGAVFWLAIGLLSLYVRASRSLIYTIGLLNLLLGLALSAGSIAMVGDAMRGDFFSRMPGLVGPVMFALIPLSGLASLVNAYLLLTYNARFTRARRLLQERDDRARKSM